MSNNIKFAFKNSDDLFDFTIRHCNIHHQQKYSQNVNVNDAVSVNFTVLQCKYYVTTWKVNAEYTILSSSIARL